MRFSTNNVDEELLEVLNALLPPREVRRRLRGKEPPPPRCRFCFVLSCYSCLLVFSFLVILACFSFLVLVLLFFSCYSCLLFFSCSCLAFLFLLFLLAFLVLVFLVLVCGGIGRIGRLDQASFEPHCMSEIDVDS